jgi:ABC-2 type transport system permease protein
MKESWGRVSAITLRHMLLLRRSVLRSSDVVLWPLLELSVGGFMVVYLEQALPDAKGQVSALLAGLIFWDLYFRAQQGLMFSFMEEVWTRHALNILITPIRLWEWVAGAALYNLQRVALATLVLAGLAFWFFGFRLWDLGWQFFPLLLNLLLFAWFVGLATSAFTMLFGFAAEPLIMVAPFLLMPVSAVFYPVSVLPGWLQPIALSIPTGVVFEDMRAVLMGDAFIAWNDLPKLLLMNAIYGAIAVGFFTYMFHRARISGRLCRVALE